MDIKGFFEFLAGLVSTQSRISMRADIALDSIQLVKAE